MRDPASAKETPSAPDGQDRARLRILATSDLHAHITPWDYHANRASPATGLARTARLIAEARAEVDCCLLVDNGDFLQGSPLGDVEALRSHDATGALHPMIAAMNALAYDAVALGNHEFSHGLEFLRETLAAAQFPLVCANLALRLGDTPLLDTHLVPPRLILTRQLTTAGGQVHPLRIGIVGFLPPQTPKWDAAKLGDTLKARDILEAAAAHVAALRAAGVDLVLALSHSGIGPATPYPWMENASAALAALPGIDALVTGHTHQVFPVAEPGAVPQIDPVAGRLWGKPAVMPGMYGSHLGVIDFDLRWEKGRWQLLGGQSAVRPIARRQASGRMRALTRSDPAVLALAEPAHRATKLWARQPVGASTAVLHSYFAMISPSPTVRLIARAQADHVRRALVGTAHEGLPVLSAAAPFHAGGRGGPENYTHIAAGALTMRHVFDLYPHPNTVAALQVTGAQLQEWLERAFSQFHQIAPGSSGCDLVHPEFPSFNFDLIEGLTWSVDLSSPARHDSRGELIRPKAGRIMGLAYRDRPIEADQRFVLATNSYRANGSGAFCGAEPQNVILNGPVASRDVVRDYIARAAHIAPMGRPNWTFCPMPGTQVQFYSAPAAAAHLSDLDHGAAEALSLTPKGFLRFRLHL